MRGLGASSEGYNSVTYAANQGTGQKSYSQWFQPNNRHRCAGQDGRDVQRKGYLDLWTLLFENWGALNRSRRFAPSLRPCRLPEATHLVPCLRPRNCLGLWSKSTPPRNKWAPMRVRAHVIGLLLTGLGSDTIFVATCHARSSLEPDQARDALPVQGDRDETLRLALSASRRPVDGTDHARAD